MPILMLQCKNCRKIFSSGINMSPGSSGTFINSKAQCPNCGCMEAIPDGTFRATVEGFVDILRGSENPLAKAQELLKALEKVKTQIDLDGVKELKGFEKFKTWLPNTPEKIAAYVAIIFTITQLWIKNPETRIEYNTFINQYNQTIDIVNKK